MDNNNRSVTAEASTATHLSHGDVVGSAWTLSACNPNSRILILFFEGWLGVAPTVINAAVCLVERGYKVDIVTRSRPEAWAETPDLGPRVRVLATPTVARATSLRRKPTGGLRHKRLFAIANKVIARAIQPIEILIDFLLFARAAQGLVDDDLSAVIGIDTHGTVAAGLIRKRAPIPIIYWSLELSFLREIRHPVAKLFKMAERIFSKRAKLVIVQDADRGALLCAENRLSPSKLAYVPNAPMGRPLVERSTLLRSRLGISEGSRVVLHAGMISDGVLAREIASSIQKWPEDFQAIFHERQARDPSEPYLRTIAELGGPRLHLSLQPLRYEEIDHVFGGADIGLVFYNPDYGANYTAIAYASGKLAHHLRHGTPIVCNALPSLAKLVEIWGCGIAVSHVSEIGWALGMIVRDEHGFRRRALRCYERCYDFRQFFEKAMFGGAMNGM